MGAIVRAYKSAVTYRVNALNHSRGAPFWQRNYSEHILRDEADLLRITEYMQNNPWRWADDRLHPAGDAPVR